MPHSPSAPHPAVPTLPRRKTGVGTFVRGFVIVGLLALGYVAPQVASATTLAQTTEAERIARADLILRGTVVEMWSEKDAEGRIFTRVMIEPSEVWKGQAPDGAVVVTQPGGEFGTTRAIVDGAPRYNVGEEVVMLLAQKAAFNDWVVVSLIQGKYTVRLDPYSREEIVQQTIVPEHIPYDSRFLPFPTDENKVFLTDLKARVLNPSLESTVRTTESSTLEVSR